MKILMVDDEIDCLDDIEGALSPTGYNLVKQTNPLHALELAKKEHFDVILTDVRMPQMSGIDLLKKIREAKPDQKVIVITAYGDLETATLAINHKAYAFFGKPIEFKDLIDTLSDIEKEISGIKPDISREELKGQHQELKAAYHALLEVVRHMKKEKGDQA